MQRYFQGNGKIEGKKASYCSSKTIHKPVSFSQGIFLLCTSKRSRLSSLNYAEIKLQPQASFSEKPIGNMILKCKDPNFRVSIGRTIGNHFFLSCYKPLDATIFSWETFALLTAYKLEGMARQTLMRRLMEDQPHNSLWQETPPKWKLTVHENERPQKSGSSSLPSAPFSLAYCKSFHQS